MSADSAGSTRRGEKHDSISHKLDIVPKCGELLVGELRVAGVKLQPGERGE